jgi:aspartyl/asparaginyl beta-hydroxylase (cupin superfamily)
MATSPENITDLHQQADAATARNDLPQARALLERLVVLQPDLLQGWLKLGSIRAAQGDLQNALAALHGALRVSPLDFMALLSKASLLERMGARDCGEAYGRALAQRPPGQLNPALERMIARAERSYALYMDAHEQRLTQALGAAWSGADPDEQRRIARFRSNTVRRTRPYHSEPSHFHFPGLLEREFHDRAAFPWLDELEAATDAIAAEYATVAIAEQARLEPYVQYPEHEPLRQWQQLNNNLAWTAIHLWQYGGTIAANARHCPRTVELLSRLPQPRIKGCSPNAVFSVLAPGTTIPPHTGVANTRLVCHLPLIVPTGCWFRVGAETRNWERGKAFVFDDTIEHEAANTSSQVRVVLIFDVWHPGLSTAEREAARAVMETEAAGASLGL